MIPVQQAEEHRGIVIREVEGGEHDERAIGHIKIVAFVAMATLVPVSEGNIFRAD